ncbi:MAG: ferrous iron transporter B, partial [Planctomycetes bacterium]|nr:ferrous iron transporter B [Planctomycetota bacterium]
MKQLNDSAIAEVAARRIALLGNPNSGKTTIFNALTGLRHKVANFPGVTVERREGKMRGAGSVILCDLPGCYSLTPQSLDEQLVRDALLGWASGVDRPDGVIIVVDASNLERNLYLASQVLDLNLPTIVVCNMMDIVRKRGDRIDLARLSRKLGVPVVGTVGTTREGIDALRTAIVSSMDQAALSRPWRGSERFETAVADVGEWARSRDLVNGSADAVALLLLSPSVLNDSEWGTAVFEDDTRRELAALHQKHNGNGQGALSVEAVEMRYRWLGEVVEGVLDKAEKTGKTTTDRIDEIVTHRVWGLLSFSAVMGLMFLAIFSWAAPIMDGIDGAISLLGTGVAHLLGEGMLTDRVVDGVMAGDG